MLPRESRYPNDWLALAEKDLQRVTRSLHDKDPELAAFCLQQAVEKFLKAYLLSKGGSSGAFTTSKRFLTMPWCTILL